MKKYFYIIVFLIAYIMVLGTKATAQSFAGKDFWFAYINSAGYSGSTTPPPIDLQVHITSEVNTTGTISIPLVGWSATFTVAAGAFITVTIPYNLANHEGISDSKANRGIHLVANDECIVYAGNYQVASSDVATLIPTTGLSTNYIATTYGEKAGFTNPSAFILIGTEDNTNVTLNLSQRSKNSMANTNISIVLNKGETYQVVSPGTLGTNGILTDLNGSSVIADKPIAVYGGSECGLVQCPACDHLFEQVRSVNTWGYTYYFARAKKAQSIVPDKIRVMGSSAGTSYTFNGIPFNVAARAFNEHDLTDGGVIVSNKPIHVSHFTRGGDCNAPPAPTDPMMLDIIPVEQYAASYTFGTSPYLRYDSHTATIVVPTSKVASLRMDGNPLTGVAFTAITGTTYSYGYLDLPGGAVRKMTTIDGTTFGLYVTGYGDYESYGYVAGGKLIDFCEVTAKDTLVCPGQTAQLKVSSPVITATQANFQWFTTATGGAAIFAGDTYTTPAITGLRTFYVQVDNAACVLKRQPIIVDIKPVPTALFDYPTAICANVTGTINYTGSAPDLPTTTYNWNFGAGATPASATTRGPINVSWTTISPPAKTVSLTVTQAGCSATASKPVTVNNSPTSLFTTNKETYCLGDIATITYTGSGTATGSYDWNFLTDADVEIVSHPDYKTYTIKWKSKGAKSISLTPSDFGCNGALTTKSITVNELPALITSTTNTSTCSATDGQVSVVVTNIVSGVYTYSWNSTPVQTAATATGLGSGAYTVTVRDPAGCMNAATALVIPGGSPIVSTSGIQHVSCNAGANGKIILGGSSGSLTSFDYTVKNKAGLIIVPTTTAGVTFAVNALKAGDYTFTVADATGCTAPGVFTINEPVKLIPDAGPDFPICPGGTGTLTASALGGVSPYTYSNDGSTFGTTNTFNYAPAATTGYTLFIKDNNGCIASDVASIIVKDGPAVGKIDAPKNICNADTATISYPLGTSSDTYVWGFDGGDGPISPNEGPNKVSWKTPGKKRITLTVARSGCSIVIPDTIVAVVLPPTVALTLDKSSVCANEPVLVKYQGDAPVSANYDWDFAGGIPAKGTGIGPFTVYWPTGLPKNLSLEVAVGKACRNTATAAIVVKDIPAPIPSVTIPFCEGSSEEKLIIPGFGGFAKWYDLPVGGIGTDETPVPSRSVPGDIYYYASQVVDDCESQRTKITVRINPKDIVGFNFDKVGYCKNDVNQFPEAKLDPGFKQGGVFTCASPGLKFKDTKRGIIDLALSTAGNSTYKIKYKSIGTCADSSTVNLRVYVVPTADFKYDKVAYCKDEKNPLVTLAKGATAGTYTVNPSGLLKFVNSTGTIDLASSAAGDYTITNLVTSRDGCVAAAPNTAKVSIIEVPGSNFALPAAACINAGVIINTADASIATAIYKWDFGDAIVKKQNPNAYGTNFEVLWNSYGKKTITYSALNKGCASPVTQKTIEIADLPVAHITSNPPAPIVLTLGVNPEIKFEATDNNGNLINAKTYIWDFGDGATDNAPYTLHSYNTGVGNEASYLVKLITSNGFKCETADSVMVNIVNRQGMKAPTIFTPNGDDNNERFRPVIVGAKITSFQVFNRWGEMIYTADNNQEGWDGLYKNQAVPNGVYVFIVKGVALTDGNTELKPEYGIVTVVK